MSEHIARRFWSRCTETARLMVGVGNYAQYLAHMQAHHPDAATMSRVEYFRYCQNARYPTADGIVKRCPC